MRRRCGSGGASGPGGGARCCRCVVAGALLLLSPCAKPITVKLDIPCRQTKTYEDETRHRSTTMKLDKNDEETRHPTHRRYRWWSGLLKGAVAGAGGGGGGAGHPSPRVERLIMVAGACSPVDRVYLTAKPGVTTLVMAENHSKTNRSGCSTKHNVVLSRRTHHKYDTAPLSLYNQHTIQSPVKQHWGLPLTSGTSHSQAYWPSNPGTIADCSWGTTMGRADLGLGRHLWDRTPRTP